LLLWDLEELKESLRAAGFNEVRIFMEVVGPDGEFTGEYEERPYPVYSDNGPNWYQAALVACKRGPPGM